MWLGALLLADSLKPRVLLVFALLLADGGATMMPQRKALSFFWIHVSFNADFCPSYVRGFSPEPPDTETLLCSSPPVMAPPLVVEITIKSWLTEIFMLLFSESTSGTSE